MARRHKRRRGIVILVVLSLLVLFTLLVATYVIVAGQYRDAAVATSQQELLGVDPQKDTARAFYQILRDTRQRNSVVRFHSILRDYHGEDGFRGSLLSQFPGTSVTLDLWNTDDTDPTIVANGGAAYSFSNGQFLDVILDVTSLRSTDDQAFTLSFQPSFYNGCVLTVTSGRAKGWSTTIVGFFYANNTPVFRVLNLKAEDGLTIGWADLAGATFMVNGRPFNGSGFGFQNEPCTELDANGDPVLLPDPDTNQQGRVAKLTAEVQVNTTSGPFMAPLALLPNHASRGDVTQPMPTVFQSLLLGGSDEPYDAVDYQNMFLGLVSPNAATSRDIIPSFHRPALINYWINHPAGYWAASDDLKRYVLMRPVEPNFDGSNLLLSPNDPDFRYHICGYRRDPSDPQQAPNPPSMPLVPANTWDVDNDGDGIPDSIWIDLGLPIQTSPDGRKYKPLFAILCVDLDGRLNVNAHGNPTPFYPNRPVDTPLAAGRTTNFPKGLGFGPGEISLASVASNLRLLMSTRYGPDASPGISGLDVLGGIKFFEEPENYRTGAGGFSSYFTPPDLRGEFAFGLDLFGRPIYEQVPAAVAESRADSQYEINLIDRNASDRPFTASELERGLRRFDMDIAELPSRLTQLLDMGVAENARLVTTDSYDPPVPGTALFSDLADEYQSLSLANVRSIQELLTVRLLANGVTLTNAPALLKELMPAEMLLGQRLDLNRPIGNGRDGDGIDNDSDGSFDEPGELNDPSMNGLTDDMPESLNNEEIWPNVGTVRSEFQNVPVYKTNGADVNQDGQLTIADHVMARQLLARHIYVLLMALKDDGFKIETEFPLNSSNDDEETAHALAQWAINIVDHRDADSIMTAFEYDVNPFNGWEVDGNLATNEGAQRQVVWGCERPEVVITETLAFHDRRTEDRNDDDGIGADTNAMPPDPHFDQRLRPRGSFFVELFNPWTGTTDVTPREFYDPTLLGVQLNKVASSGGTASPVWRLFFARDGGVGMDPEDFITTRRPNPATEEFRFVYFVNPVTVGPTTPPTSGVPGVYATTLPVRPLQPGRYTVVGSAGIDDGSNNYISPVGRETSMTGETSLNALNIANTRRVVLSPTVAGNQVHIYNDGAPGGVPADPSNVAIPGTIVSYPHATPVGQPADAGILPATAIVIDTPQSLSVSEPVNGYAVGTFVVPGAGGEIEGAYTPPRDIPLDLGRYLGDQLMDNATVGWGTIHLQRLANPNLPFHSVTNPYRTIDSQRVDLTTFNGVETPSDGNNGNIRLFAVQRGDQVGGTRQFWPQEPFGVAHPDSRWLDAAGTHYFNYHLRSTLGSLNHGFWPFNGQVAGVYRGSPSVDLTDAFNQNNQAFSSLSWNNRPFVSAYELLQVPVTQSSQLLRRYTLPGGSPYHTDTPQPQYGHLVNFFHSSPSNRVSKSAHAYRLLEYVHVPSRYLGTELVLNPNSFRNHQFPNPNPPPSNLPNLIANPSTLNPSFLTPFNRISKYRDPGKVNINTIYHPRVWNALFGGYSAQSYDTLVATRRGFGGAINTLLPLPDPRFPTYFANPFRPPGHGSLVPLRHLEREDIETTLLRSGASPPDYGAISPPNAPSPAANPLLEGGHVAGSQESLVSTNPRNSFFRYNALRRLGNMVTTRSNVYAIWITVGYFEMEPNNVGNQVVYDDYHPEGLRVGQEIGIDTGEIRRHRAFYMIDRTIPVAFDPGENHNVDKCVLLRRFIE